MFTDEYYFNSIRRSLQQRITAVQVDSKLNLQDLAVLSEGFYCELLNILLNIKLENANLHKQNIAGIDLIDETNHVIVQISATCKRAKIQESISKTELPAETGKDENSANPDWHFIFVPIVSLAPKYRKSFVVPSGFSFDFKKDIFDVARILQIVRDSSIDLKKQLFEYIKKCEETSTQQQKLKDFLNRRLEDTWKGHPSYKLMQTDEIDKSLFPQIAGLQQFETLGTQGENEGESPVWAIVKSSWNHNDNHSIVIMGDGGIGKTVTLFSLTQNSSIKQYAPAVYVPVFDLVDSHNNLINLSDYLISLSKIYGESICELASQEWNYGPKLLLLLDGFNEVSGSNRRLIRDMINNWTTSNQGTQVIAVSRPMDDLDLSKELSRDPIAISLSPLSRKTIKDYLCKWKTTIPKSNSPVWKSLAYPLFLNLYIRTDRLASERPFGNFLLSVRSAEGPGAIIWNFLQRELLRRKDEMWVIRCAIACEYVLPSIAHMMVQSHEMTVLSKKASIIIRNNMKGLDRVELLPKHIQGMIAQWNNNKLDWEDRNNDLYGINASTFDWADFVLREVGSLVPYNNSLISGCISNEQSGFFNPEGRRFAFMHQIFRDCLAGIYLINQAELQNAHSLPNEWKTPHPPSVMDYAAELIPKPLSKRLWELNRTLLPTSPTATYTIMELQRRLWDGKDLNWAGMDLSGVCLVNYLPPKGRMRLFSRASLTNGTQLGFDTFQSQGHSSQVTCVEITANNLCITGSIDRTIRVWDLFTGACILKLEGHSGSISCISVGPANTIVSGSMDQTLRIWEMETGKCKRSIPIRHGGISSIAIKPDGLCAIASSDGTISLCNIQEDLSPTETILTRTGKICQLSFSEDNLFAIIASEVKENTLKTLHVQSKTTKHSLFSWQIPNQSARALAALEAQQGVEIAQQFSSVARFFDDWFVTFSENKTIQIQNIVHAELSVSIEANENISFLSSSSTGEIFAADRSGLIVLLDARTGKRRTLNIESGISCISTSSGGVCVTGFDDGAVSAWNTLSGDHLWSWRQHAPISTSIGITKEQEICTGHTDGTLRFWSQESFGALHVIHAHDKPITCLAASSNGLCVSGSEDGCLKVWNTHEKTCTSILKGHRAKITCISLSENGICVSGSADKSIIRWDITNKTQTVIRNTRWGVDCLGITNDGLCVSNFYDGKLQVFNVFEGSHLHTLMGHSMWVTSVAINNKGICASGSYDRSLIVWDMKTGEEIHRFDGPTAWIRAVDIDENGNCVCGGDDSIVYMWNIFSKVHFSMPGHVGRITDVKFGPNSTIISCGEDSTIRVWSVEDGHCLASLNVSEAIPSGMIFSKFAKIPDTLRSTLQRNGATFEK